MRSKLGVFIMSIFLLITPAFASFTYSNYGWYSYSDTLSHGEQTSIQYVVQNTNSVCSMSCSAKMVSNLGVSDPLDFSLSAGQSTLLTFYVRAPTKSEADYKSSGSIDYELDVDCYDVSSFLCDGSKQSGEELSQTEYKIIYELSQTDENNKAEIDRVLDPLKENVNEFNKALQELESKYDNARNQVLVTNVNSQINSLNSKYNSLKSNADSISEEYEKLDFSSAIQSYNSMPSYNHYLTISQIQDLEDEIDEAREKHNQAVNALKSIQSKINKLNDDAYLFKLDAEYKSLVSSYDSILGDLNNLDFSSYESLNIQINSLDSRVNSFEIKVNSEKEEITNKLKQNYLSAYLKIGENKQLTSYSTKDIIDSYCYDFNNVLPQKFNTYNQLKEKETIELNEKRVARNLEIDSFSSKWNELNSLISEIKELSQNNYHDNLENSCNQQVISLQSSELTLESIENTINTCSQFKTNLQNNIEENSGFFKKIVNFFSSIFSEDNKVEIDELNNLDNYKNNQEIIFEPVSFSEESKSLSQQYCNINIEKVYLDSSQSVGNIEKDVYSGGDVVDFKTQETECDNNKCYDAEEGYPILFVHGHLFDANSNPLTESIDTFDDLIRYIAKDDSNFYDAGKIVAAGSTNLGTKAEKTSQAAMYRTTYYGGAINNNGEFIWVDSKYDSISDYADKLKETIDSTLALTNRKQVKIVAHSMGGLVVREYIRKYGDSKIDTFIMIATPNQGVVGDVASNCAEGFGSGSEIECNQMKKGSSFLSTLNSMSRSDLPDKTYIFSGVYSNSDSDGVVLYENTKISGVKNYKMTSSEVDDGFWLEGIGVGLGEEYPHSQLLDPNYAPNTASNVIELLK